MCQGYGAILQQLMLQTRIQHETNDKIRTVNESHLSFCTRLIGIPIGGAHERPHLALVTTVSLRHAETSRATAIFQLDGATPPYIETVLRVFQRPWIGRRDSKPQPPRSPDFTYSAM
jgi:hypothetical protein